MKRQLPPPLLLAVCIFIWIYIPVCEVGALPFPFAGLLALAFGGCMIALLVQGLHAAGPGWKRIFHLLTLAFAWAYLVKYDRDLVTARSWLHIAVVTAALFCLLLEISKRMNRQEAQDKALEDANQKSRELVLRAKLAPHFIFNTLNTLHAQIAQDPQQAQATTEKLAQVFRQVVQVSDAPTIPLRQELSFVEAYLGIEQARLGDRLQVRIEIPEELESIEIPPLSLQVLVENAVKHGVAPLETGGLVRISASIQEAHLVLEVDDPGDGHSTFQGTGTAISTLRQRLSDPCDLMWYPIPKGFRFAFRWPLNPELP